MTLKGFLCWTELTLEFMGVSRDMGSFWKDEFFCRGMREWLLALAEYFVEGICSLAPRLEDSRLGLNTFL